MNLRHYPFAIAGYIIVSPLVAYWLIRAWLAGGADHD